MLHPKSPSLFSHLALALAGVCLSIPEFDFLAEMSGLLAVYLLFVFLSWYTAGRLTLSGWWANTLALGIAVGSVFWIGYHLRDAEATNVIRDVPLPAAVIPFLGPVLMALLLVRLYRPRSANDFWLLQGVGLLQVALGCVLAATSAFAPALIAYLVTAACALAAHEGRSAAARGAATGEELPPGAPLRLGTWLRFSFRWVSAVSVVALPLFFFSPRLEGPEWEPFAQFGSRKPQATSAKMGFGEEIDLTRTGSLEADDGVAFTATATDAAGNPRSLPATQLWRGIALERYEEGIWRSDMSWMSRAPGARLLPTPDKGSPEATHVRLSVPGKTGGLFVADPVRLPATPGHVPVWHDENSGSAKPTFVEIEGHLTYLHFRAGGTYGYTQALEPGASDRYPTGRATDGYLYRCLRVRQADFRPWTRDVLKELVAAGGHPALAAELAASDMPGESLPPRYWEEAARLLSDHLAKSGRYGYSLTLARTTTHSDPVMDFLVNVRHGPCERFASALALMLRSVGVPARIVKGYRGAERNPEGEGYLVRQSFAHAWVEACVVRPGPPGDPSTDWLVLDPTPSGERPGPAAGIASWLREQQKTTQSLWEQLILGYNSRRQKDLWANFAGGARQLGSAALFTGCALLAAALVRRYLRRRRSRSYRLAGLWQRLAELATGRLGVAATPGQTPRELADAAGAELSRRNMTPALVAIPGRLVDRLYRQRFGGEAATEAEVVTLTSEMDVLERAMA